MNSDAPTQAAKVIETKACTECFAPIEAEVIMFAGRRINFEVVCDACYAKLNAENEAKERDEKQQKLVREFETLCPPLYRESDPSRIFRGYVKAIADWKFGPTGLLLIGPAGRGKTRAAWMLMRREHLAGRSVYGLTATELAKFAADQWHSRAEEKRQAEEALHTCKSVGILLIDDLGKQKFTERAELELYDILESRTANMKPTIVTANSDGSQLLKMLSADRGEPILRRLQQFSTITKYNE